MGVLVHRVERQTRQGGTGSRSKHGSRNRKQTDPVPITRMRKFAIEPKIIIYYLYMPYMHWLTSLFKSLSSFKSHFANVYK